MRVCSVEAVRMLPFRHLRMLMAVAGAVGAALIVPAAGSASVYGAPFGVGDSAGNIRLNSTGSVVIRWVARHTGTISRLWVKTRTVTHGGAEDSSYYGGTTGVWQVNTTEQPPTASRTSASCSRLNASFRPRDKA